MRRHGIALKLQREIFANDMILSSSNYPALYPYNLRQPLKIFENVWTKS